MTDTDETYCTREEIAALLNVHLDTVRKWGRENVFPEYQVGGAIRYRKSEVLAAIRPNNDAARAALNPATVEWKPVTGGDVTAGAV